MNNNKFKSYLKRRQPFGDSVDLLFVNDALMDKDLPDPKSWEELENYIQDTGDSKNLTEVLSAAKYIWNLYIGEVRWSQEIGQPVKVYSTV